MGHKRLHNLEHMATGQDAINVHKLGGIKIPIPRQLPARSDYVKYLSPKSNNVDEGVTDWNSYQVIEEGTFIYIQMSNRILKCNKSDLAIVNSYEVMPPNRPTNQKPMIMCITTSFLYFGTEGQEIVKLNKSDLSYVARINIGIVASWVITDGTFIYTASYNDALTTIQKLDLNLTPIATLPLVYGYTWNAVYDTGFIYIAHEEGAGLYLSKIDVSSFTSVGTGNLSASYSSTNDMATMGSAIYMTAYDLAWDYCSVIKVDKTTLSFVAATTPVYWEDLYSICGDGTHLYFTGFESPNLTKIDANLTTIETVDFTPAFHNYVGGMAADANNLFWSTMWAQPTSWYKSTKTSIVRVAEVIGKYPANLTDNNSFCSDGESIFYVTAGTKILRKMNIATLEVTDAPTEFPYALFGNNAYGFSLACDDSKVYIVGDKNPLSKLVVCDINTLEILSTTEFAVATYGIFRGIILDENYIYISGQSGNTPSKITKLNKATYAVESKYTSASGSVWRYIQDIVIAKDDLYALHKYYNTAQVRVVRINPTTMTEVSFVEPILQVSAPTSGMVYDGKESLFYAADDYINSINTDTMTATQILVGTSVLSGIGIGNHVYTARLVGTSPNLTIEIDVFATTDLDAEPSRQIILTTDDVSNLQSLTGISQYRHLFVDGFLFFNIGGTVVRVYLGDESNKNTDTALRDDKLIVDVSGNTEIVGELKIKVYSQGTEPVLGADQRCAYWINTSNSNRVYLLFRRGVGDQVTVELA